jgi:hypothetical protein
MGWGRAAGALIALLISCALIDVARGGDLVECEPQRVTGGYWAYRIIDGRECWYQGQPGKPKNELFWPRAPSARQPMDQPEAGTKAEPPDTPSELVAVPPEKPEATEAMPEQWRASAADQLLAFTCCWPELALPQPTQEPATFPQPTQEPPTFPQPTQEPQAWLLALLPLGLYALWWIARPRRGLRAVRAHHAGRVAAAQPHPPAPPMQPARTTSLFVLPIDERQHASIASLVDAHLTPWLDQARSRLVTERRARVG